MFVYTKMIMNMLLFVYLQKDVPFSVCDPNKDVSFEKPELPMMFEVNGDNAKNPIKIFVGKPNFSKETF